MVDTRDLKSLGPQGLYEFESRPRHKKSSVTRCSFCFFVIADLIGNLFYTMFLIRYGTH